MRFSKSLCLTAFLAGPISSALGALTYTQITDETQRITNQVNKANSFASSLTILTGDANVNNVVKMNQDIATALTNFNGALQGSKKLTTSQQKSLVATTNALANSFITYFHTLGKDAGDFEVNPDQSRVQDSANAVDQAADSLYGTFQTLGANLKAPIDQQRVNIDNADMDMNNDDASSPLRH